MGRSVTLVLVAGTEVLGALPPFPVPTPYRQEVAEVVAGARTAYGLDVVVLRLLHADGPAATYLAELAGGVPPPLRPVGADHLRPHPLRAPYAVPGGPAASLAWARGVLGPARANQLRTWNLSSIWRLEPESGGPAWLKEVPAFFGHEGAMLTWLAGHLPGLAPTPLAVCGGRLLLADVPGPDRYEAPAAARVPMLDALHRVQVAALDRLAELGALGVPDRRWPVLAAKA
ncbi:MAG TPA: aminoglycoside phosphotransferase family protein, partial [Rugosimonospora sp.]|nr:aminoglycoside phosphotransferase family protein [Rugosimonospora sp.]